MSAGRGLMSRAAVGDAVSAGVGLGLGFVLNQCLLGVMAPSSRVARRVIVCLSCGGRNAEEFKFCGHCGRSLYPPVQVRCQKCGAMTPDVRFCGNCGYRLKE